MAIDIKNSSIEEKFHHLKRIVTSEDFLSMSTLAGEVPFYICPFENTEDYKEIDDIVDKLYHQVELAGKCPVKINLYDLCIEILKEEDDWEWILENESKMGKDELIEELQSILDVIDVIAPRVQKRFDGQMCDVLFITGVGEVFPYIRSHNLLNNLQSVAKAFPTVLFFPGKYTTSIELGSSLDLFGRLHDDKYYRAFNIFEKS